MEEQTLKDVQESSPDLYDAIEESSTSEENLDTESSTSEQDVNQGQQRETPFHEHPRWKEVQEEKRALKAQNDKLMSIIEQSQRNQPNRPEPKGADPYGNMTPEEERFYRAMDTRIETAAKKIMEERLGQINPMLNQGFQEIAAMKVQQFRAKYPDIKPESPEEHRIAELIRKGLSADDAYYAVQGPNLHLKMQAQASEKAKQRVVQKQQANLESGSGVSSQAQPSKKLSFEEDFLERAMKEGF